MVGTPAWTTPAQSTARELGQTLDQELEVSWHLPRGRAQAKVTTLFQSRSRELRGKNVNEDTILNVEPRTLCELAP